MRQGKYLGTYAPIGYKKDPLNKHFLIIDEETAPIVRRIFKLRCEGMGYKAIVCLLNEERVPSPRVVYYEKVVRENPRHGNKLWNTTTVNNILRNECYIGNMVQGKSGSMSYKNRTQVKKAKEDWVRVENTHEPLVSMGDWATVRSLEKRRHKPRADSDGRVNIFSGLLRCADCGFTLRSHIQRQKKKDGSTSVYYGYICNNYARSGKMACTTHMIRESVISQLILEEIRSHGAIATFDEQRVIKTIMSGKDQESISLEKMHRQQLKVYDSRLTELDRIIRMLYEDRVAGIVTDIMFKEMMSSYEKERSEKSKAVQELGAKIEQCSKAVCNADAWVSAIRKYSELEELTREVLLELIDSIEVFEPEKVGKQRICRIQINYRFVGSVSESLEGGESNDQAI